MIRLDWWRHLRKPGKLRFRYDWRAPRYNILKDSEIFTPEGIAKIEARKDAVYVCDTCLRSPRGGWNNEPVAIFWNKNPDNIPKGGSAWFGLFYRHDRIGFDGGLGEPTLYITNAISAVQTPDGESVTITGVIAENGDVIYSRYRHDYRLSPDGTAMVDGGRDYLRTGPVGLGTVELQIREGELCVI